MEVKLRRGEPADELLTTLERHNARRKMTGVSAMAAVLHRAFFGKKTRASASLYLSKERRGEGVCT